MQQSYEHLIGREVVDEHYGQCLVVAGIDPYTGVTLVDADDPTDIVYCFVRPSVHEKRNHKPSGWARGTDAWFDSLFQHMVEGIETGVLSERWHDRYVGINNAYGLDLMHNQDATKMCAFR